MSIIISQKQSIKKVKKHPAIAGDFYFIILLLRQEQLKLFYGHLIRV